ncbi:hypothetical protein ACUY4R_002325 [Kosakonia sp. BK9b]
MADVQKLLSITIPTYNRADYLKRLLESIQPQIKEYNHDLEVIIIDNASADHTQEVVSDFLSNVSIAQYIRNDENLGMDGNFKKCFESATAKYFWMIGDDDVLSDDAIANVISVLKNVDTYNLLYISSTITHCASNERLSYNVFTSSEDFIKRVGIMFTFISGMVCNKQAYLLLASQNKPTMIEGSFLMHMYWQLPLLKNGKNFAVINNKMIYATPDNSGGYRLFHVFSKNLSSLLDTFYNRKDFASKKIRSAAALFLMNFLNNAQKTRGYEKEDFMTDCDYAFRDLAMYRYFLRFFYLNPALLKFSHQLKPLIKRILGK